MNDTRIDIAGAIVFWSFGAASHLNRLQDCLECHGFTKHCPERMTDGAALKAALAEEFPAHKVFPIVKDDNAFEVVRIREDDGQKNRYEHVLSASVTLRKVETSGDVDEQNSRIQSSFDSLVSMVPVSQLTRCMVSIVSELGGMSMKPSGGVYWLPEQNWDRWVALVDDVTDCGSKNRFDACRVVLDSNCIEAVRQALTNEIEREAKAIHETITDPESGTRAAKTARKRAESLRDKILSYEDSFGLVLSELHTAMDNATTIEATATFFDLANAVSEGLQLAQ